MQDIQFSLAAESRPGAWNNCGHVCGWYEIWATRQLSTSSSLIFLDLNTNIQIQQSLTVLEYIIPMKLWGKMSSSIQLSLVSLFQSFQKQGYIKLLSSQTLGLQQCLWDRRAGLALKWQSKVREHPKQQDLFTWQKWSRSKPFIPCFTESVWVWLKKG